METKRRLQVGLGLLAMTIALVAMVSMYQRFSQASKQQEALLAKTG